MQRISCIIPTYNRGAVLCETIAMLLQQTLPAHEIIVIDQTHHHPPEVANQLSTLSHQGLIRWILQTEPNASRARNSGALLATGDILLFLDDDILVADNFLAAHGANYKSTDVTAVAGQILDGDRTTTTHRIKQSSDPEWDSLLFPKNYALRTNTAWMASGNMSIQRKIYIKLGGMDERYSKGAYREESDFAIRYYRSGNHFIYDPDASIYHLGANIVPSGGCRNYSGTIGGWHHFLGAWYFTWGFASWYNFLPITWLHFRTLVFNRRALVRPIDFGLRLAMFVAAAVCAGIDRLQKPWLIDTRQGASL